jgi:cell division protein FtsL
VLKLLNLILAAAFLATASWVYGLEHRSRAVEGEIAELKRRIGEERETMRLLHAEWANLARPARLQQLALRHLRLEPLRTEQLIRAEEIRARVPRFEGYRATEQGADPIAEMLKELE